MSLYCLNNEKVKLWIFGKKDVNVKMYYDYIIDFNPINE